MVALGGALGAVARYLTSHWVAQATVGSAFPWGTWVVNVVGSFLLGLLMAVSLGSSSWTPSPHLRLFLGAGFCGALTTFSTFSFETLEALEVGGPKLAAANIGLSLAVGLLACGLGWQLGSRF